MTFARQRAHRASAPVIPLAAAPASRWARWVAGAACAACALLLASCGGASDERAADAPRLLAQAAAQGASSVAADYTPLLQRIYLAYFGRPADPAGLAYFAAGFVQGGVPTDLAAMVSAYPDNPTVKSVIDGFGTSAESQALYPGDNGAFISAIYANLFNRAADAAGKAYWVDLLDRGRMTRGAAAIAVLGGAQSTDRTLIDRKAQVAANFTAALDTAARSNSYDGLAANALVRALLAQVALDTDVAAFQPSIDAAVAALLQGPSAPGVYALAGSTGDRGALDGHAGAARFQFFTDLASGVATDAAGNLYISDNLNNLIRKITPAGDVSTVAGVLGSLDANTDIDGPARQATFTRPAGIAIDGAGNLYVLAATRIRRITPAGEVSSFAGSTLGFANGAGAAAMFNQPQGICIDAAGNLYVADTGNNAIRKVTPQGHVTTLAGMPNDDGGFRDGAAGVATFRSPVGIAIDAQGTLFVTESINRDVRRIGSDGIVSTVAGLPNAPSPMVQRDGVGKDGQFLLPGGIAAVGTDTVYVLDALTVRKITGVNGPAAVVTTLAGRPGIGADVDGVGAAASFANDTALGVDSTGALIVTGASAVRRVTLDGTVSTLAGLAIAKGTVDGMGSRARFGYIGNGGALAPTPDGSIIVADNDNGTLRLVAPYGAVSTIAGLPGSRAVVDGSGANARFKLLRGVARDDAGTLYVSDEHVVRKVAADGSVSTLAGRAGVAGTTDGVGAAARFGTPNGLLVDAAGTVYVLDFQGTTSVLRKITPAGAVSTLATLAVFQSPCYAEQLAMDGDGMLYVACYDSQVVMRITPAGALSVLAGSDQQTGTSDGAGAAARFNVPGGIVYDPDARRLLVTESESGLLRAVTLDGQVSTVAGTRGAVGVSAASALPGTLPRGWGIVRLAPHKYAIAAGAGVVEVILP